jgi:hypothetical protein
MASSTQISNGTAPVFAAPDRPQPADERAKSDLWIFREGRREVSGPGMLRNLVGCLASKNSLLDSLIEAGELESALADLSAPSASAAASLTDSLAFRVCSGDRAGSTHPEQLARKIQVPKRINISPPEGFTYYALHPLDYARVVGRISVRSATFAVIGIRSIGTTLSAVTTAALNARGHTATRITVRPIGHPYARSIQFSGEQERWIAEQFSRSAHFLVVDEGPGRSGSTFLSVAEALRAMGVHQEHITVVGSREFDPESLCAENAVERWGKVHFLSTIPSMSTRFQSFPYIGGGDWRPHFFDHEDDWPESWTQMERLKFLSPDRRYFIKFEGIGPLGREARARAFALAEAGFSPGVSDLEDGFLAYVNVEGKSLRRQDLSVSVLESIARYCSFRASEFGCPARTNSELTNMLEYNVQREFGRELKVDPGHFTTLNPVLADGRMQPFEWIASRQGELLKTDAVSHGDNHFFPGPCDIAWDLAGTIVEWNLDREAKEFLLRRFQQLSGVDVSTNLDFYTLAYYVFRLGFCKMAASTVLGTREQSRLDVAHRWYRAKAAEMLESKAFG